MARIRTIKPEFWTSGQVMECSPIARLLFIGLWNFCDDMGRHPLAPKQLKALVFPSDDMSVATIRRMLDELSSNGLLAYYAVDGKDYFQITGWRHQKIDKPQPSKYPEPGSLPIPPYNPPFAERSANAPGMVAGHSENGIEGEERRGEEGKEERKEEGLSSIQGTFDEWSTNGREHSANGSSPPKDTELILDIVDLWNTTAIEVGLPRVADITKERQTRLRQRIEQLRGLGYADPIEGFKVALAKIRGSPFLRGANGDWRADFDFLLQKSSFLKLLEGSYETPKTAKLAAGRR